MAIINAYFDESGKKGDHPVVTFTGVCVSHQNLNKFDDAWSALLRKYELKSLHMFKALRLKGINGPLMPRHQSINDRIVSLTPFADCINEHLECGLIQAVDIEGFNSLSPEAKVGIGNPDDPYYLAFSRGILALTEYVQEDDKISLICDDDESTALGCYAHYRAIRKVHEGVKKKIVSLSFSNDEHFPALQAADMVAYLSRLEAKRLLYGDKYAFRPLFEKLVGQRKPDSMRWFNSLNSKNTLKNLGAVLEKLKIQKARK